MINALGHGLPLRARLTARAWRGLFLLMVLVMAPLTWAHANHQIHLVLSESGGVYQALARAFRGHAGSRHDIRVWHLSEIGDAQLRALSRGNDLLVPVGLQAARSLAEVHAGSAPVLMLMVPRASAERIRWPASLHEHKRSAVYVDQPVERTLALVRVLIPSARTIGLVVSSEHAHTVADVRREAARRGIAVKVETVTATHQVTRALRAVLDAADVLLLVPDSVAVTAESARSLLLTTYRAGVPVIGFSEGLSRAGAVASVYSSPAQIGRQGAILAERWSPVTGALPGATYATEHSLAFNAHVAKVLGLQHADPRELRRAIGAAPD